MSCLIHDLKKKQRFNRFFTGPKKEKNTFNYCCFKNLSSAVPQNILYSNVQNLTIFQVITQPNCAFVPQRPTRRIALIL